MTNQAPTAPRLETIDFGRYPMWRTVLPGLIATLVGFGTPLVLFSVFVVRDLRSETPHENVLLYGLPMVAAYLLIIVLMLFYGVFGAYRTTLLDEGVRIRTWTGVRMYPWSEAKRAALCRLKYTIQLNVSFGRMRRAVVQLHDYRKARSLYEAVRSRLPLPVEGHAVLAPLLADV
ncbi:MAG: hypothetical protein IT459_22290 [Planctomycetes bacterium]|nr:hypothetical protein [Planctomycetota bacterium]